jgi:hypothetical protein
MATNQNCKKHMKNTNLLVTLMKTLFLPLLACIPLSNFAYAKDDRAIEAAFMKAPIMLFSDGAGMDWAIVQGKSEYDALSKSKKPLFDGFADAHGNAPLSTKQRGMLYKIWKSTPNQLWYLHGITPYQITPVLVNDHYELSLVDLRYVRDKEKATAINKAARVTSLIFTQKIFDAKPFAKDFTDWQKRFTQDIAAFDASMRKDRDYGKKLLEDTNQDGLKKVFWQSIDTGKKGLSLRGELISAYYAAPGHEGTEVTPSGDVFTKLVLSTLAKPVGFGGTFTDDNTQVELWYMVFDDVTGWTVQDFNDSIVFEAFRHEYKLPVPADATREPDGSAPVWTGFKFAELPPYKTIKRNSWPALVFMREADGKIKLYGMSIEMATTLGHIYNRQLF